MSTQSIAFHIHGLSDGALLGRPRAVRPMPAGRALGATAHQQLADPDQHVVRLDIESPERGGETLSLWLHPETAMDLLLSQEGATTVSTDGSRAAGPEVQRAERSVRVPHQLRWAGDEGGSSSRGAVALGLAGFEVLTGLSPAKMTADTVCKLVDGQVNEGVYRLQRPALAALKTQRQAPIEAVAPVQLVLIHGTFSESTSTFAKWWSHPSELDRLFSHYGDRVYALDHRTLGASPIENAIALVKAVPEGNAQEVTLDLVTHSRGGLVAEVLVRACRDGGLGTADLAALAEHPDTYAKQAAELQALVATRKLRIRRVARVAAPVLGTNLASNRLDAYFSVLAWLAGLAVGDAGSDTVGFLKAVAAFRGDPRTIPGLEAMRPGGAIARWLGPPDTDVPGELRVVAGDTEADSLRHWLRGLLALSVQGLYRGDNDLVVDTAHMYAGARRRDGALYRLFRGASVDHVHYFEHADSAQAITDALVQDAPAQFGPIGALSAVGKSSDGDRAARAAKASKLDATKPALIMLPGVMGSHLSSAQGREWLHPLRVVGLLERIQWGTALEAKDWFDLFYDKLRDHMAQTHEVHAFAYDWRAPLEASADLLAKTVREVLDARKASAQPLRLLAHSMGGLVVRVMALRHPALWKEFCDSPNARLVMLGTPNHGSWAPMMAMSGDHSLTAKLALLQGIGNLAESRQIMAGLPGLLQLQAGLNDLKLGLNQRASWEALSAQDQEAAKGFWHQLASDWNTWGVPTQNHLNDAAALWTRLDQQPGDLGLGRERFHVVLGSDKQTAEGIDTTHGVNYRFTHAGDGTVPWASTRMAGAIEHYAELSHGDLPCGSRYFEAYEALLSSGERTAPLLASPVGGARALLAPESADATRLGRAKSLPSRLEVPDWEALAMGSVRMAARMAPGPAAPPAPKVTVTHGDIRFTQYPILLGHYSSLKLTGTERVVNQLIGEALQHALEAGVYPNLPGECMVLRNAHRSPDNPFAMPRPQAVVVVGLGQEGSLRASEMQLSVRLGVMEFLRLEAERHRDRELATAGGRQELTPMPSVALAITNVGSGGALSVPESAMGLVRGVLDALERIPRRGDGWVWPLVSELHVVELYGDRASEAWHALNEGARTGDLRIRLEPGVRAKKGALTAPVQQGYRGADEDLIRVTSGTSGATANDSVATLEYTLMTSRARSEVRAQGTQRALVDKLVRDTEASTQLDSALAQALYQLLVPLELRAYVRGSSTVVLELDSGTAQYPWELLAHTDSKGKGPLSVLRRLAVRDFRRRPASVDGHTVLVIGMSKVPTYKGAALPALPGVTREIEAVRRAWSETDFQVKVLKDEPWVEVIKPFLVGKWRVLHVSGHGIHEPNTLSGAIMGDQIVLSPAEFQALDFMPELVFLNCCFLGKVDGEDRSSNAKPAAPSLGARSGLAANVAEQLIRDGVRCVVAAGWAVDDAAAAAFAETFYESLAHGATFGAAVQSARERARQSDQAGNTWAAYQCYGDPNWRLWPGTVSRVVQERTPEFASGHELRLWLEHTKVRAGRWRRDTEKERQQIDQQIRALDAVCQGTEAAQQWLAEGRTAEAVADAWMALGVRAKAIDWYAKATGAPDGRAGLRAHEQWLNCRVRDVASRAKTSATAPAAVAEIAGLIKALKGLTDIGATAERWSLIGSAHKRTAMLIALQLSAAPTPEQPDALNRAFKKALLEMAKAYESAATLDAPDQFYPLQNQLHALSKLALLDNDTSPATKRALDALHLRFDAAVQRAQANPDFWSVVAPIEMRAYVCLAGGTLSEAWPSIREEFEDLHRREASVASWQSVHDTARFILSSAKAQAPAPELGPQAQASGVDGGELAAREDMLDLLGSYATT